jgi:endo-1,4-beta-xylanase
MKNNLWTRRQVISSLAALPLATNATFSTFSKIATSSIKPIQCKLLNSQGEPYEVSKMERFHICDLINRPFVIDPQFNPGEIIFNPEATPFRISLPVEVPGFGEVFCYADNKGKGYTAESLNKTNTLLLNFEFAVDRLATVNRIIDECRKSSIAISSDALSRVNESEKFLEKCKAVKSDNIAVSKWSFESLRESLWAGEMVVIERAKARIETNGDRKGFLFGANAFAFREYGTPYTKYFESLFNYATLPFYMSGIERTEGQPNYSRVDSIVKAMQNTQIICKGHPLIFYNDSTPVWARNKSFAETKKILLGYIRNSVFTHRGRLHVWDVINEMHVQPDAVPGMAGFTKEQNVELTCAAAKAAREADPTCFRIVNSTGTWGDYYMGRKHAIGQQNVYDYLKMMEDAKCDYEAIGLQYYHSGRDLLEFEHDLERFAQFNKPIHITEVQIPSSSVDYEGAAWWGGGTGGSRFPWHGKEFTETIQADWVESVYTMLFSKPYINAITWWDIADPAFVPYGGLLNRDMTPKESYFRLKTLLDKWKAMS